jgi:hypothetical protein
VKYGLGVFREDIIINKDLHREKIQSITHLNEWVQCTFEPQSMVQSRKDQNRARTSIILNQLQGISSPELVTSREGMSQEVYNPSLCINLHLYIIMY